MHVSQGTNYECVTICLLLIFFFSFKGPLNTVSHIVSFNITGVY